MEDQIIEEEIRESGAGQEEPKFETSGVRSAFDPDDQAESEPTANRPEGEGAAKPSEPRER